MDALITPQASGFRRPLNWMALVCFGIMVLTSSGSLADEIRAALVASIPAFLGENERRKAISAVTYLRPHLKMALGKRVSEKGVEVEQIVEPTEDLGELLKQHPSFYYWIKLEFFTEVDLACTVFVNEGPQPEPEWSDCAEYLVNLPPSTGFRDVRPLADNIATSLLPKTVRDPLDTDTIERPKVFTLCFRVERIEPAPIMASWQQAANSLPDLLPGQLEQEMERRGYTVLGACPEDDPDEYSQHYRIWGVIQGRPYDRDFVEAVIHVDSPSERMRILLDDEKWTSYELERGEHHVAYLRLAEFLLHDWSEQAE